MAEFVLDRHESLFDRLMDGASGDGHGCILRAQSRRSRRLVVQNGKVEEVAQSGSGGMGLHLFDEAGHTSFGSVDGFDQVDATTLLDAAAGGLASAAALGLDRSEGLAGATPHRADHPAVEGPDFDAPSLAELRRRVLDVADELRTYGDGLRVRVGLSMDREEWRIRRGDGTDVRMVLPRCHLSASFSGRNGDATASVRASVSSGRYDLLSSEERMGVFRARARRAAATATRLPTAPHYPAGSYPLVIDYALAKGLAHEAFGHAAESDSFRSSILARDGRFRRGVRVGRPDVSVIDEPIRGDHADQPVSANGVPRQRVTIVREGVLNEALGDLFSAGAGGVPVRGSGRAESYRHPPLPRMSNIRIEMDDPVPLETSFEEIGPEDVRDLLGDAGLLDRHGKIVFLSGYGGGQVNPVKGDFVFNCHAIYELTADAVSLYRPAIFSGPVLEALGAVERGFGPLQLDAIGTCGKWGQSVPSCGGSNYFLFLEPKPHVVVGGR